MALPVNFGGLSGGNQALSLFDTQSAALGALGVIPCAASGTNSIVLTPNVNTPTISSYTDLAPSFEFTAAATSTGNVTINAAGLGSRQAYKWNGQQVCGPGDIVIGGVYKATFLTALNSGAGGFVVDTFGAINIDGGPNSYDIEFVIDGGGVAITTGNKGQLHIQSPSTIAFWRLIADQVGSIAIDILRANVAVPTVSMVGGGTKPNLAAAQILPGTPPVGWTSTVFAHDDWIAFNVTSAATVTRVTIVLSCFKT